MPQYLPLPDGSSVTIRDGESPAQAWDRAQQMYPEAFGATQAKAQQPESGGIAAAKAGYQSLKGDIAALAGRTGLMDVDAAEKYKQEREAEAKQIFKPTEAGWTESPFTKLAELGGGSLPYMAAPIAAGALGAMTPVAGAAAGAAGLASLAQFTGSNLSRQVEEGASLKDTNLGSAAAAALPMAALDMVSLKMSPGIRSIFAAAGKEIPKEVAEKIAKQGTANMLKDYGVSTLKTMGAEGLTEAGQQFFERLQAGLSLTDEKARDEYWDNLIGGAVLGGVIAPAGRYAERGSQQKQEAADDRKAAIAARLEQEKADAISKEKTAQEEELYKSSPDYAKQVASDYAAAEQKKTELQGMFKDISDKSSPTLEADKAFNKDLSAQLKAHVADVVKPLGQEYNRVQTTLAKIEADAKVANMSPEEFMLQNMGEGRGAAAAPTGGRMKGALGANEVAEQPPADTTLADYAAGQVQAARDVGHMDLGTYADYMMQKPALAEQLVKARPPIEGLTRKETEAVYGGLNMRLKAGAKLNQKLGAAGTAAGQQRLGTVEAEEAAALEAQRAEEQRMAQEASAKQTEVIREQKIAPEVAGIQRLGKAQEGSFAEANAEAAREKVARKKTDEALVNTLVNTLPKTTGKITPGQVHEGLFGRDTNVTQLKLQLAVARLTNNRDEARRIVDELRDAKKLDAEAPQPTYREKMPAAGEGEFSIDRKKERDANKFIDAQNYELMELIRLRENKGKLTTPAVREEKASAAKEGFVAAHAAEINARREVFGLPPMADWEKAEARARVLEALNELDTRWGKFGAPVGAVRVLQQQTRDAVQNSIAKAAERAGQEGNKAPEFKPTGPRIGAPDELTLKGEPRIPADDKQAALNFIDMVLRSVERRTVAVPVTTEKPAAKVGSLEDIAKLYSDEKATGTSAKTDVASVELLTQLKDALATTTDADFIGLAREQAQQIAEGNLPNPNAVRELGEMMKAQEVAGRSETKPGATQEELQRTSAQPQKELFPEAAVQTQRATPSNFQKMLDSKNVQGMREAIAKQKEDNRKALEGVSKTLPTLTNKIKLAETKYESKLKKTQAATPGAKNVVAEAQEELTAINEVVKSLEAEQTTLQGNLDEIEAVRDALLKEPDDMRVLLNASAMLAQEKPLRAKLKNVEDSLATANALEAAIRATQDANKTVVAPLLKDAEKADKELTAARKELDDLKTQQRDQARIEADAAEREKNADATQAAADEEKRRAVLQRGREGLNLPGIRIEKDTTKMRKRENQLRSAMGSLDEEIANADTPERKAEMQKRRDAAQREFDALYAAAPVRKTELLSREDLKNQQELDDAQAAAFDQAQAKRRAKAGEAAPTLKPAIKGPLVKEVKTGKVMQEGKRGSLESEGVRATEGLIKARSELADTQRRIKFLQANGKDKVKGRLTPLMNSLRTAEKEQLAEISALTKVQSKVEAAAAETNKVLAESRKPARLSKADEAIVGTDATQTTSAQQDALTADAKEALADGRILDVLTDIAQNSKEPFIRENAEKLLKFVSRTKIGLSPDLTVDGEAVPAAYNSNVNAIGIRPGHETEANVVHEATHAATMRALEGPESALNADQLQAKQDLTDMFNLLTENGTLTGEYAAKNVKEFASEVQSNANLRDRLDKKKLFGSTILRRVVNSLLQLIGIKPSHITSAEAQAVIERLYMQSGKLNAPVAPAGFGKTALAPGFEDELETANNIIAQPKTVRERIESNLGLAFRTQVLDRLAPLEKIAAEKMDAFKGTQMMYFLRMADQKMSFVQQSVGRGVPQVVSKKRADGQTERLIESKEGPNLANVVSILKDAPDMNAAAANKLFTLYLAGKRAERVGYDSLNFGVPEAQIRSAVAKIEANPELRSVFESARNEYNAYNRSLMKFVEDTGAITPEEAKRLSDTNDYIPYYREENGNAVLVVGGEGTFKVGNLTDQPQLRQLIGGDTKILDFLTSSVQNTSMLMDMGLRNQATKNAMYELNELGLAKFLKSESSGQDIVRFKDKGEDKYVAINTDEIGIPADLLVKGMAGIPVNNSAIVKAMGGFSTLLRRAVTLSPLYSARQLFRDSVAAPLLSGANFTPVVGALKQLGKSDTRIALESRGIVGGQVFTGTNEDLTRILGELQTGKMGISQFIAKAEAVAMEADALTRRAQYDSYLEQGLSEMEATLMSLESMNFNRKGLSPSVRMASTMIPFFNAQIQSLDVLYRALKGSMPMNERLDIQGKLIRRGAMLAGTAVAYAMLMQDDDTYKNANPDEKYGNFFVHVPGLKESIRVPVPFEIGYIFKSLPEAIVNTMNSEHGSEEAYKAFKNIAIQTVPGGSSMFLPAALKPIIENVANYSFYTGRGIETKAEQMQLAENRFRDNTSEAAKMIGKATGVSPIKLENLIRGYTGGMGVALMQSLNMAMPTSGSPEQAAKRLSDAAVIGPLFQPADAGGIVNATYERVNELLQYKKTFDDMVKDGRMADAKAFIQEHANEMAASAVAGNAQQQLGKLTQAINAVKASSLPADQKRERLDSLQAIRIKIAGAMRGALDKTTRP
jgi:Large polyvalent protein associated domain 38